MADKLYYKIFQHYELTGRCYFHRQRNNREELIKVEQYKKSLRKYGLYLFYMGDRGQQASSGENL